MISCNHIGAQVHAPNFMIQLDHIYLLAEKITTVCMHALSARNSLEHILCSTSGTFAAMHLP
jgi:hypothetical protein